jgi:hypothetical protein
MFPGKGCLNPFPCRGFGDVKGVCHERDICRVGLKIYAVVVFKFFAFPIVEEIIYEVFNLLL